ncbi:MAG: hypothetical protein ACFFB5_09820 [Promethearchaeota archaeon]
MLESIEQQGNLSVKDLEKVLDAVHAEDPQSEDNSIQTLYTTIYDLKNKDIYLYYFHDYDRAIKLNLETELANGFTYYLLEDLYSTTSTTSLPHDLVLFPGLGLILWLSFNRLKKKHREK